MKTQTNFMGMSLTDIIFENRNKAYGAYQLRQTYNSSILKAMVTTTLFAVLLILVPKVYAKLFPQVADSIAEVKIDLADIPKVIIDYVKPAQIEPPIPTSSSDKPTALFGL